MKTFELKIKYKTFSFISYNLKISPKFYLVAHISFIPTLLFSFTSPYQILFLCLLLFSFWLLHLFVCPPPSPFPLAYIIFFPFGLYFSEIFLSNFWIRACWIIIFQHHIYLRIYFINCLSVYVYLHCMTILTCSAVFLCFVFFFIVVGVFCLKSLVFSPTMPCCNAVPAEQFSLHKI